jgi:hypothetical protein
MTIERGYSRGTEFPSEAFVQQAIERHFRALGFAVDTTGHVDLLCSRSDGPERWHIEAKGKTSQCGLDFRTCLGQLVQRMRDRATRHGVALPDIPQYRAQLELVSPWVVEALGIHWLLVASDGSVEIAAPKIHDAPRDT